MKKTVNERIDALQSALKGKLKLPSAKVKNLQKEVADLGESFKRIIEKFGPESPEAKILSKDDDLTRIEAEIDAARPAKPAKPPRPASVFARKPRASGVQPEVKTARAATTAAVPQQASPQKPQAQDVKPAQSVDEQLNSILSEIDPDVDWTKVGTQEQKDSENPQTHQDKPAEPEPSEEVFYIEDLPELVTEPEPVPAESEQKVEVHYIEEPQELVTEPEPSVQDAMAVLDAAFGDEKGLGNEATRAASEEAAPTEPSTKAPAQNAKAKIGMQRAVPVREEKIGRLNGERMIAMMNDMREIAENHGAEIKLLSGSIRGAEGARYEVKIGEVTIAINRTTNPDYATLSDVTISFKSPNNPEAKKQAQAIAQEAIPKIAKNLSQITANQTSAAEGQIQQAQLELAHGRLDAAVKSKDRVSNISELAAAVKIITASEAYQDCHKQQFANDLQSMGKGLEPKPEHRPKHSHSDNEMDAFKAIEKLDKLLDRAKAVQRIPLVSNIVQNQLRQHLDRMNGTHLNDGLKDLSTKKAENVEFSRTSMKSK